MKNKNFDWPEEKINLQDLFLDLENYRLKIEPDKPLKNQKDVIDNLIENDDILSLAKQISEVGFVPIEKMIALKKGNKYIVLEGNRRLVVLKCLVNPQLAKKPHLVESFETMAKSISTESIKKIPVFIAPSRIEAMRKFIIPKHTEPAIKKWSPYNKVKLYAEGILNKKWSINEVCSNYGTTSEKVLEALRVYQCYEIAKKIPLNQAEMKIVLDERKFPITTLDRLVKTSTVQKFLGIQLDDKGILKGNIKKEEFIKGYSKIISDLALKQQTSRTLDKDSDRENYLKSFKHKKPNLREKGTFSMGSFKRIRIAEKPSKKSKPTLRKRNLKDYNFFIPGDSSIILKVYKEIEIIDFHRKPYTFVMVFRAFLHMCCSQYVRNEDLIQKIKEQRKEKRKDKYHKDPTLKEILVYFYNNTFKDGGIKKSIGKFINEQNTQITTLDTLNSIHHSNTIFVNGELHKNMLDTLEQFLRALLKRKDNANS